MGLDVEFYRPFTLKPFLHCGKVYNQVSYNCKASGRHSLQLPVSTSPNTVGLSVTQICIKFVIVFPLQSKEHLPIVCGELADLSLQLPNRINGLKTIHERHSWQYLSVNNSSHATEMLCSWKCRLWYNFHINRKPMLWKGLCTPEAQNKVESFVCYPWLSLVSHHCFFLLPRVSNGHISSLLTIAQGKPPL